MNTVETAIANCKHGVLRYIAGDQYVGRSLELYGEFSDMEAGFFAQLLREGQTVVEIGANIGAHTVHLSRVVGARGRVLAFEPQAAVHGILADNLARNKCANAAAICAAVGERAGLIPIPRTDYSTGGNYGAVALGAGEDQVPIITLDSLQLDALHVLKIDVEGMEASVLRGGVDTIRRLRPILYVENDREARSEELISLIQSLGYRLWWHLPPLYSPHNMRGNRLDVFPGVVSINMACIPAERKVNLALREVLTPKDTWKTAAAPIERTARAPAPGQKTIAVVRLGAYGDCLWASSILPHLKADGYHVTVYTESRGEEVLRHDPHIDQIIVQDHVATHALDAYWKKEAKRYDRFINLTESVEKNMIAIREDLRFYWPDAARREIFGDNYLERVHQLAGVPGAEPADFRQRFYPTEEERTWARAERATFAAGPLVVVAAAGSSVTKSWPHISLFAEEVAAAQASVVLLGDPRDLDIPESARVRVVGTDWTLRQALAFAQLADVVVGQETGILNAVAMEPMKKIVLLTHSTERNLTRHWVNTVALSGNAPCWPCHRIHQDWSHCTQSRATGKALCQTLISPAQVMQHALPALARSRRKTISIAAA